MKAGMKRSYEHSASVNSEATLVFGEPSMRAMALRVSPERKNYVVSSRTKAPETRVVRSSPFSHDDDSSVSGEESGYESAESQTLKRAKLAMVGEDSLAPGATTCTRVDGGEVIIDRATVHRRSFAVVCSSNMNRSMMAHKVLKSNNMSVRSFGVGRCLMLPSGNPMQPRCFGFGTPYAEIRGTLVEEDEATYCRNGVLGLLDRNAAVKTAPERWQSLPDADVASFDVVVCVEQHVFSAVLEDYRSRRDLLEFKDICVVLMAIKDTILESAAASDDVLRLCRMLEETKDLNEHVEHLLQTFSQKSSRKLQHRTVYV